MDNFVTLNYKNFLCNDFGAFLRPKLIARCGKLVLFITFVSKDKRLPLVPQ